MPDKPIHYVARFCDGHVAEIGKSKRTYTHAWRVTARYRNGEPAAEVGFAGSERLAAKASQTVLNRWTREDINPIFFPVSERAVEIVAVEVSDA